MTFALWSSLAGGDIEKGTDLFSRVLYKNQSVAFSLLELAGRLPLLVTVEENALAGGFGSAVLELLEEEGVKGCSLRRLGYPDRYIEQGEQPQLRAAYGLDAAGIAASVRKALGR